MTEALMSAIANRTSTDPETRSAALGELLKIANFSDHLPARMAAIKFLHEFEGVAIITDAAPSPVLATSNGVRVEPAATDIPTTRESASAGNVVPFRR